jgi:hypothetical protein
MTFNSAHSSISVQCVTDKLHMVLSDDCHELWKGSY